MVCVTDKKRVSANAFDPTAGRIWWKLLLILAVLVGGGFAGLYFLRPVAMVVPVTRDAAYDAVVGSLTVKAERAPTLTSEVSGRIVKSNLELAGRIEKGETLVELDSRSVRLEIDRNKNELATVEAQLKAGSNLRFQLETLVGDLEYENRLLERGSSTQVKVDTMEREQKSLEQRIELERVGLEGRQSQLENAIAAQELQLEKMTLRSPVDGMVNYIYAFEGDLVTPNAPIADLISLERRVEVQIGEEDIQRIQPGQPATVQLLSINGETFTGTVDKVLPAANVQTRRYSVFLNVEIEPEKLKPGTTGEALIYIAERENTLIIPRRALVGNNVFVVANGTVDLREVKVGYVRLNQAEILSGVEEGENVIVQDLGVFSDGQRVRTELLSED